MQKPQPKNLDLQSTKSPRAWNDINFINSHRKLQPADTRHNHRHPREETETQRWQRQIYAAKNNNDKNSNNDRVFSELVNRWWTLEGVYIWPEDTLADGRHHLACVPLLTLMANRPTSAN